MGLKHFLLNTKVCWRQVKYFTPIKSIYISSAVLWAGGGGGPNYQ